MKTMKTISALVIAGLIVNSTMASGNLQMNITSGSKGLEEIEITNVKVNTFEIDVKDENGNIIFDKETENPANNYKRNYDFSRLDCGTYFFTVVNDIETTETKFNIELNEVKVVEEKKIVDPVFVMDNKQLKLTYLNFAGENTLLIVYDDLRNQLYEKDLKSDFVTQHGIDFSKAPKGNYEVVLSIGNNVRSYDIFMD